MGLTPGMMGGVLDFVNVSEECYNRCIREIPNLVEVKESQFMKRMGKKKCSEIWNFFRQSLGAVDGLNYVIRFV